MIAGLCSVTFRQMAAADVVTVACAAGLEAVEWGGDVHVPAGAIDIARDVLSRATDAGLSCPSYGSYLVAGRDADASAVASVLDTAVALGAANVRVWCAKPERRAEVVGDLARISREAGERGLTVSLEFHPGTVTETATATVALLDDVPAPNLFTYWQPHPALEPAALLDEAATVAATGRLSHLHVFRWDAERERLALADGDDVWPSVIDDVSRAPSSWDGDRVAFLEFVRGDDADQLLADAATLRRWLS